jgi:hypothetical protein
MKRFLISLLTISLLIICGCQATNTIIPSKTAVEMRQSTSQPSSHIDQTYSIEIYSTTQPGGAK